MPRIQPDHQWRKVRPLERDPSPRTPRLQVTCSCLSRTVKDREGSLRGSPVQIGTIRRILAWPMRKDDTHKSRSV